MEKALKIRTRDGKIIDGILRGSARKPLVLLVHGLCSNMNEAVHYNAARFFEKQGFSTFRFNLYSWGDKNRRLHECTLGLHGKDIRAVVDHLRSKGTKRIFAVGHSYGLPSILFSDVRDFNAIVSWDGTCLPSDLFEKNIRIQKPVKGRLFDEGYWTIVGEAMARDELKLDSKKMLSKLHIPIKFITVEKGHGDPASARKMFRAASQPKMLVTIKGANHNFTEDGKQEELYKETIAWIRRFNRDQ